MVRTALIVLRHLRDLGPSRFMLDLAAALPVSGVAARIFSLAPGDPWYPASTPHTDPLVPVEYGAPPWWRRSAWFPLMTARLAHAAAAADVVVAGNETGLGLLAAFLAAEATGKPVVATAHRSLTEAMQAASGWEARVSRLVYPRLDAVVCGSQRLLSGVAAAGVPEARTRVIPPGTDQRRLAALAAEPPPDWLADGPFVVALGSLTEEEGFDLLIEAHAAVRAGASPHRLVLLGEGPQREPLEDLIARLGLGDTVQLPGFVRNPFPILGRASLCCLPRRMASSPLTLVEALTLGTPVIAADSVSGPPEVTSRGDVDLVPVNSAEALASAMARRLNGLPARRSERAASDHGPLTWSVEKCAQEYASLFEDVAAGRAP